MPWLPEAMGPRPDLAYRVPPHPLPHPPPRPGREGGQPCGEARGKAFRIDDLDQDRHAHDPEVSRPRGPCSSTWGGPAPSRKAWGLVAQGRADGVYSVIAAELSYMAKEAGLLGKLTTVYLPDPPIELFVAISPSSSLDLARFEACQKALLARRPMAAFLEPYLGAGASL